MMTLPSAKTVITIVFSILFPLILMLFVTNIFIFHAPTYQKFFEEVHDNSSDAETVNTQVLSYFSTPTYSLPLIEEFTPKEAEHIRDVKVVLHLLLFFYVTTLLCFFFLRRYIDSHKVLVYGPGLTVLVIIIGSLGSFNTFFISFHDVFFVPGSWIFSSASTLIQTYPFQFFYLFTKRIVITSASISIVIFITALLLYVRRKRYK